MMLATGCSVNDDTIITIINNVAHGPKVPYIIGDSIYSMASEYINNKFEGMELDKEQSYMNSVKGGGWYEYLFVKGDRGLGFEVYNDGENITDSVNIEFRGKRKSLIEYMGEIMPENIQYNEYVKFNPYGTMGVRSIESTDGKNILKYVVVKDVIDSDIQREKDIKIIKKYIEISKELGVVAEGATVKYIETENTDIEYYKDINEVNYEFSRRRLDRYNSTSSLYTGKIDCSNVDGIISVEVINYGIDEEGNIKYLDDNNEIKGGE